MGGGSLWDVAAMESALPLVAGEEPTAVSAQADYSEEGVDTNFAGTLRFPAARWQWLKAASPPLYSKHFRYG